MLIQIDNRNSFWNLPIHKVCAPEKLRDLYGEKIDGETVTVFEDDETRHEWEYKNGKYVRR